MEYSTTQRSSIEERLVPGVTKRGDTATNWDLGALPGAGAILSTASDLAAFARANFDTTDAVLSLQLEKTYTINEKRAVALGWIILYRGPGQTWYWHNGGTGGYRSSMVLDVANRRAVVVLSNISAGHSRAGKIDELSYALLEMMKRDK